MNKSNCLFLYSLTIFCSFFSDCLMAQQGCNSYFSNSEINHLIKKDSILYIGTENSLIKCNVNTGVHTQLPNPGQRPVYDYYSLSIAVSSQHEVYLCAQNALLLLRNNQWDTLLKGKGEFVAVTIDDSGQIWTYGPGILHRLNASGVLQETISKYDFGFSEKVFGMVYFNQILWIAKPDALYAFDGDTVVALNELNTAFPSGHSIALYADKDTLVYGGVELDNTGYWKSNFVAFYSAGQWSVKSKTQFPMQSSILRSIDRDAGSWYFFSDREIFLQNGTASSSPVYKGLHQNFLISTGCAMKGTLYAGTDVFGMYRLPVNQQQWEFVKISDQNLHGRIVSSVGKASNGNFWAASWNRSRYRDYDHFYVSWRAENEVSWHQLNDTMDGLPKRCSKVINGRNGQLFFVNEWAAYALTDTLWNKYPQNLDRVTQVALDNDSNLWVSTRYHDFNKWDGNNWTNYEPTDFGMDNAQSAGFSPNGDQWFASGLGMIVQKKGSQEIVHNKITTRLPHSDVFDVAYSSIDSSMVFVGGDGVLKFKNNQWRQTLTNLNGMQDESFNDVEIDPLNNNIWYATPGDGVLMQDAQNKWYRFTTSNSCLTSDHISEIRRYGSDIWVVTENGLVNFSVPANKTPLKVSEKNLKTERIAKADDDWVVYPNPADHMIYTNAGKEVLYTLTDITGQIIKSGSGDTIPADDLAQGIYILFLKNGTMQSTVRLSVVHP